ncbi:MAG: hypothetical protein DRG09_00355 [Epsilonproteobacteria bacterium]|nr:MAG: hypothetical protein DRG09_00355 [Campylobacterota bacterium]
MDRDPKEYLKIDELPEKENYTEEEKQIIMDRLNEERLIHQRVRERLDGKIQEYTEEEKSQIISLLNEQRLSKQKREEIKNKRIKMKKKYKFGSREFYKFTRMEREYFIEVKECESISGRPTLISLYYRTFEEFKKKDVLIKTEIYSEYFFISYNPIRVYFKTYALEDEK